MSNLAYKAARQVMSKSTSHEGELVCIGEDVPLLGKASDKDILPGVFDVLTKNIGPVKGIELVASGPYERGITFSFYVTPKGVFGREAFQTTNEMLRERPYPH
jgi:hypothetical protein